MLRRSPAPTTKASHQNARRRRLVEARASTGAAASAPPGRLNVGLLAGTTSPNGRGPRLCQLIGLSCFEWGYGGSGPAQLALALAASRLPDREALAVYQELAELRTAAADEPVMSSDGGQKGGAFEPKASS